MLQVILDEFVNGYSLAVYDNKYNVIVREVYNRKADALASLANVVKKLMDKEIETMQNSLKGV